MARFTFDIDRVNVSVHRRGKEWELRVLQRAQTIFTSLLGLLPSSYVSAVQGPNYTVELKAVAVELAKIELALEAVDLDRDFSKTRSHFLWSIIGYLVFVNGRIPPGIAQTDEEFRRFLLSLIQIYFQGSIPQSINDALDLVFDEEFEVLESFLLERLGASGVDISNQFEFQINLQTTGTFPADVFNLQSALRIILDLVRPAHTIFTIRYIFDDEYIPNGDEINEILDSMRWQMSTYYYDDFRSYWQGLRDRDRLGKKTCCQVTDEDHSADF